MRPFLACLALLPLLFTFTWALNAGEELKVRTTLSRFAIFVDDDDFDHLDQIFTPDVYADYAGSINKGLPAFEAFLRRGLGGIVSQHAVSTTVIEDLGDSLNSTAYVTAGFLGPGKNSTTWVGSAVTLYGKYHDTWTRVGKDWRIKQRIFEQFSVKLKLFNQNGGAIELVDFSVPLMQCLWLAISSPKKKDSSLMGNATSVEESMT
ncbi:uncharacterized protein KY384_000300 [Bacidia gigantensis]|uniref:uncharacterized protein n=1 Tax=Bacidia gigantensis TaxID=2732470 RepID=UPI001D04E35A|nr:uncharacterized protein KY384_000300 [Bacidia gigantensis]KAG8526307.1 hypothetical protein KY384_000300 [Bacidia gigantensis]